MNWEVSPFRLHNKDNIFYLFVNTFEVKKYKIFLFRIFLNKII